MDYPSIANSEFKGEQSVCIELQKRISIIKASIYDVFFSSNDPKLISFNLILNRIILLVQKPITFVIYQKEDNKYFRYHSFMLDEVHKDEFDGIMGVNEYKDCLKEYIKNPSWLFNTYSDKYKIAVYKIIRTEEKTDFFLLKNSDFEDGIGLENYLNEQDGKKYEDYLCRYVKYLMINVFSANYSKDFIRTTEDSIKGIKISDKKYKGGVIPFDFSDIDFNKIKRKFTAEIDSKIDKSFIKVNKATRVVNSLCVENDLGKKVNNNIKISNILFFVRDYSNISICSEGFILKDRKINGYSKGYDYNIRISIPRTQREEIEDYFLKLNESDIKDYINDFDNVLSILNDEWFWKSKTEKSEKDFLKEIISILSSDLGDGFRLFSDPVFQNGLVHFRKHFQRSLDIGLTDSEIISSIDDIPSDKLLFCKKYLLIHYLFLGMGMVDKAGNNDINIVLIPIELNGRVFAVTSHIILVDKDAFFQSNQVWQAVFHLYSAIGARVERNIRKDIKASVVDISCKSLFGKLSSEIKKPYRYCDNLEMDSQDAISIANKNSFLLSLFMPYGYVRFNLSNDNDEQNSVAILLDDKRISYTKIKDNKFFPRYKKVNKILGKIDQSDFKHEMLDRTNQLNQILEEVLRNIYESQRKTKEIMDKMKESANS